MIAIVIVAHSPMLAAGLREMVAQCAPDVRVHVAAGTSSGTLGTSAPLVESAIRAALHDAVGAEVVVFLDLGSATLAIEIALEALEPTERARVRVSEGPLVEGAILAAVAARTGAAIEEVIAASTAPVAKLPPDFAR